MWRIRRQITVLMVPILFIGFLLYFFYNKQKITPTCFDNIKNQNETEIDCGGNCIECQLIHPENMQTIWARAIKTREGSYDTVVNIKNPNKYWGTPNLSYEIELRDNIGALIGRRENITFVLPKEELTIVETDIRTKLIPKRVEIKIKSPEWKWSREYMEALPYDIELLKREYSVRETPQKLKQAVVKSAVFNHTAKNFSFAYITIFVYDKNKNIIAVNKTVIENLASGEIRPLEFYWPEEITEPIDSINGEIRINKFEQ